MFHENIISKEPLKGHKLSGNNSSFDLSHNCPLFYPPSSSHCRKNQQYDSKWYIPLTELTFQGPEETEPLTIPQVPDEELDAMKVKISHLRSEIQREKVVWIHSASQTSVQEGSFFSHSSMFSPDFREPTRVPKSSSV